MLALIGAIAIGDLTYDELRPSSSAAPNVTIVGPSVSFDYTGLTHGYLRLDLASSSCPATAGVGSFFECTITLNSTALLFAHFVDGFRIESPFGSSSVAPELPWSIGVGASVPFTLGVVAPASDGSYTLSITVITN